MGGCFFINLCETQDCSENLLDIWKTKHGNGIYKVFSKEKNWDPFSSPEHVQNLLSSEFLVFRLCQGAGPLKSSRKHVPLTQGSGLNPNHDGSSTERDVPKQSSHIKPSTTDTTTTTTHKRHTQETHTHTQTHTQQSTASPHHMQGSFLMVSLAL